MKIESLSDVVQSEREGIGNEVDFMTPFGQGTANTTPFKIRIGQVIPCNLLSEEKKDSVPFGTNVFQWLIFFKR